MSEWETIETAPKEGTKILAVNSSQISVVHWHTDYPWSEGCWMIAEGTTSDYIQEVITLHNPTHWMPLPKIPPNNKDD